MKSICTLLLLFVTISVSGQGVINIIAGDTTGTIGFGGDGGPATLATLANPAGICSDNRGNIYVADFENSRVRKIDTSGIISTFAGSSSAGFGGDGGPATSAQLYWPVGVAADRKGNLYISDQVNLRIRKVDKYGNITTIAGNGTVAFGADGGPATATTFSSLNGICTDTNNMIYITDLDRIRRIDTVGIIKTIAGTGLEGYSGDNGPATNATFFNPVGITLDHSGNLYIADQGNSCIRKVTPSGTITTVAGNNTQGFSGDNGPATAAQLNKPYDMRVDNNSNIYIADAANNRIRRINGSGVIHTIAGGYIPLNYGFSGPACNKSIPSPVGLEMDSNGNLFITAGNNAFEFIDASSATDTGCDILHAGISLRYGKTPELFPNPTYGQFTLDVPSTIIETVHYAIINSLGQIVQEGAGETNTPLNIEMHVPNGVYLLSASVSGIIQNKKVVVVQ